MFKVMTIFGTRPETIKMAPVVHALQEHSDIQPIVCVTAQHRQMLDQVLQAYNIHPDYDLDIMQPGQSLTDITARVLMGLQDVLSKEKPDAVLVHGDTTTAMTAALAAFYQSRVIGHVEAGLRTFDKYSPYPEEMNRKLISSLADLHFAPTEWSRDHLLREQIPAERVFVTGNTAIDALQMSLSLSNDDEDLKKILDFVDSGRLLLLTAHRRENLGQIMYEMFQGIAQVLAKHPETKLVYPVHLNPQVQKAAQEVFGDDERVRLIKPLDVLAFHHLLSRADIVLTDSGGIQEEAPSLGKPVLVLRDTTERPEGVAAGTLCLAGTKAERIATLLEELLTDEQRYAAMAQAKNPYGDGRAAERIVRELYAYLQSKQRER